MRNPYKVYCLERALKKIDRALEPDSNTANRLRDAKAQINHALKAIRTSPDDTALEARNNVLTARLEGMREVFSVMRELKTVEVPSE